MLVAQVRTAVVSAQAASLRRRDTIASQPLPEWPWAPGVADGLRSRWIPKVADVSVGFHGTTRERRGELLITPGRPRLAWMTPWRVRQIEIRCGNDDGWAPRLHIDGLAVDIPGTFPHP